MILKDFITKEKKILNSFLNYWNEENKINPENFPINLKCNEWEEQFDLYKSFKRNN